MTLYIVGILITTSIFAMLAIGLNLLLGYTGLFTIAHAAVFRAGAYASAIAAQTFGFGFLPAALAGMIFTGLLSAFISLPTLRVSGDYLVLASFAMQEVLYSLYINLDDLTGGSAGLQRIPRPDIFGYQIETPFQYLALYVALLALVLFVIRGLVGSTFGLLLQAIREDEIVPQALGKDVVAAKVTAFIVAGVIAGLAGSLYAHYYTYIDPVAFDVHVSVLVLSMVLIGGMGTQWGPLAGAMLLIVLPEALRFFPFPTELVGALRQICYGAIIVLFCFWRPTGLVRQG